MKKVVLIIITIIFSLSINAQENNSFKKNNIYFEYLSINYERMLTDNTELNFPMRIGGFYWFGGGQYRSHSFFIPMSISVIKKMNVSSNMFWEVKAIINCFYKHETVLADARGRWDESTEVTYYYAPGVSFGIRRHDFSGGFYYHLHFQVYYNVADDSEKRLSPWLSVGLGHTF